MSSGEFCLKKWKSVDSGFCVDVNQLPTYTYTHDIRGANIFSTKSSYNDFLAQLQIAPKEQEIVEGLISLQILQEEQRV